MKKFQILFKLILFLLFTGNNIFSQTIWIEDFNDLADGTVTDVGPTAWNRDVSDCTIDAGDFFEVQSQQFHAQDIDGEGIWSSEVIDISSYSKVSVDIDISETGNHLGWNTIDLYYKIDGGSEILFHSESGNYPATTATALNLSGSTIQIVIRISHYQAQAGRYYNFDNVTISEYSGTEYYAIVNNGLWSDGGTWSNSSGGLSCGCIPDALGIVHIENGYTVQMDSDGDAMDLTIYSGGELQWSNPDVELQINNNGTISVESGGFLNSDSESEAKILFVTDVSAYTIINEGTFTIEDIELQNQTGSLTFSGSSDITITDELYFPIDDVTVTNDNTGTIYIQNYIHFDEDNCELINNGTIDVTDDLFVDAGTDNGNTLTNNASGVITFGDDFNFNNGNTRVNNYGILNLNDQFLTGEIDFGSTFYNYAGGTWNYGGPIYDSSVRLYSDFTGSTFNYNFSGDQDIISPWDGYWHLTLSNTGTKEVQGDLDINGDVTISGSASFDPNTNNNDLEVAGNWSNTSSLGALSFDQGTETVTFDGDGPNTISNSSGETFYNLVINKTAGTILTANNNITVTNLLTMTEGVFDMGTNTLSGTAGLTATGGDLQLAKTGTTLPELSGTYNVTGGTITFDGAGNQTIKSLTGAPLNSNYWNVVLTGSGTTKTLENNVDINGNLTINSGVILETTGSNFALSVGGNWTNSGGTFNENSGTVTFDGPNAASIINASGETFYNFTLNKTTASDALTLSNDISVDNTLIFNDGHLVSSAAAMLTMTTGATVGAVSNDSHVKGLMAKMTTTTAYFEFPVGDGSAYRPIGVTPASGSNTYEAEYFLSKQLLGDPVSVDHISASEYWTLERTAGTANATVTLSWDVNSSVDDLATLLVANWDGVSDWISQCPCSTTGNPTAGTITSSSLDFSTSKYFTLGGSDINFNPLSNERYSVVGGTGNWDDANSWAYRSGGTPGAPAPTALNIVYIEGGDVIVMNSNPGYCRTLTVGTATGGSLSFTTNGRDLNISDGGLTINANGDIIGTTTGNDLFLNGDAVNNKVISHTSLTLNMQAIGGQISGNGGVPSVEIDDSTVNAGSLVVVNDVNINGGSLTNDGTLNVGLILGFQASDLSATNNGTLTIGDDLAFNQDRCTITNNGSIDITDDIAAGWGDNDNIITNTSGNTFTVSDDFNINNSNFTINNYGTFNLNGSFLNGEIDTGSDFYNFAGATWNYGGASFDGSTQLYCNYDANIFNYNAGGNQDVISPQDAYWHVNFTNSGTKETQGDLTVNGDLTISGTATLDVSVNNNDITLLGDWSNSSSFNEGNQTVTFEGSSLQTISNVAGETFYNVTVNNSGSGIILGNGDAVVSNLLLMTQGNINANSNVFTLGTDVVNVGLLSHSDGTIIGQFERWINATGSYILFPVGTATIENFATIYFNNLTDGSLIVEFLTADPTDFGTTFPLDDAGTDVADYFSDGYWDFTAANSLASTDYDLQLNGNNFSSYTVDANTRILKHENPGTWTLDGDHAVASPPTAKRTTLVGGISTSTTQFGLGYVACSPPVGTLTTSRMVF